MAYVGDWNNHKDLNSHILDWRIEDIDIDNGDQVKEDWMSMNVVMLCLCQTLHRSYRVHYTELYEHLPWLTNSAEGLVTLSHRDEVRILLQRWILSFWICSIKEFQMVSKHHTCLLPAGLWCLSSRAVNTFSQRGEDTNMREVSIST